MSTVLPKIKNKNKNKNKRKNEENEENKNTKKQKIFIILDKKNEKILRIASINLRKGIDTKLIQVKEALKKNKIDILLTQEWGGWAHELSKYEKCVEGYTNFCSFKSKKGHVQINKSLLVMNKEEIKTANKSKYQARKRGTTILIRNELINQLNINEIKIKKDGEIEAIELTINNKKLAIINIHAEPCIIKAKKEIFFNKLSKIIDNIDKETKILVGGDANSIWQDSDTTGEGKDKSIKKFCKNRNLTDLMWKKRKREEGKKEAKSAEYHTWEREQQGLTKRLDSFWGGEEWVDEIGVYTMEEDLIDSDHKMIVLDWKIETELDQEIQEKEQEEIKINNKKMKEELNEKDWEKYKLALEKKIKESKKRTKTQKEKTTTQKTHKTEQK